MNVNIQTRSARPRLSVLDLMSVVLIAVPMIVAVVFGPQAGLLFTAFCLGWTQLVGL